MTNIEIIERLYKEGNITFSEAITLGMNSDHEQIQNVVEHCLVSRDKIKNKIAEECIEGFRTTGRLSAIVEYMHKVGWRWIDTEITEEAFENKLRSFISDTLDQMFAHVALNNIDPKDYSSIDKEFGVATAGFRVVGYFDTAGTPSVDAEFVAAAGYGDYPSEEFSRCV